MQIKTKGFSFIGMLSCVLILGACSSKPESADIRKELTEGYACPVFELSDVKKIDGAEVDGKLYDVAFTYTVSIKGGKDAAAKLFAEHSSLVEQMGPAKLAYESAMNEAARGMSGSSGVVRANDARNVPAVKEAADRMRQIEARLTAVFPCEGMASSITFMPMQGEAKAAAKSGQEKIAVPVAIKMTGNGRMSKAESGWHFTRMPNIGMVEIVKSEPTSYPRLASPPMPVKMESGAENDVPPATLAAIDATPDDAASGTSPMQGPSFDCAKASTNVEKAICADPKLAEMDAKVVEAYKNALAVAADKDAFKKVHANWRKNGRDACPDATCIAAAYQRRLAELK
ncbi:DUF1311 domain-containing protein [Herbaspirillum sp. HC18]|nr:DUF1311 domain-containing protein [Herbaspirillum sp. HC18]